MGGFLKGFFHLVAGCVLLAVLGILGTGGYLAYTGQLAKHLPACVCGTDGSCCPGVGEKGGENNANFDLKPDGIAASLVGRSATTEGLVWNFMADQKIAVKVLETRVAGDTAVVAVQLSAESVLEPEPMQPVPPPPAPKPIDANGGFGKPGGNKTTPAPAKAAATPPKSASLSGVARIQYDHVAGVWYLTTVESLSLKITAK